MNAKIVFLILLSAVSIFAADLYFQQADANGNYVNVTKLPAALTKSNITTSGTTAVQATAIDRVSVNTAGASGATMVLKDGTNAFASATITAQASLTYNAIVSTGTLFIVTTGSNFDLTVISR